jgi:flagellar protein FlbD
MVAMIPVTKINGSKLIVNAELIRYIESTPDTMITLTTGDRLIVKETPEELVRRAVDYGRSLRRLLEPAV